MDTIRVLIVEDEGLYRDMLRIALSTFPYIDVTGSASNGQDAIRLAAELGPDVVLMDIELGSSPNGIEAAHCIRAASPSTGIVILSMYWEKQYIASLRQDQAAGWSYLRKQGLEDT